jgi:cytochrome c oxidase assembly factor CtaG
MTAAALVTLIGIVRDLAVALTVGGFLLIAAVVPPAGRAATRASALARAASAVWAVSAVAFCVASYSSIAGRSPTEPSFGAEAWAFLTGIALGQTYLQVAIAAVLTSIVAGFVRTPAQAAWALAPAAWALAAQALAGHSAGATDHNLAISAMFLHLVGSALWLGTIVGLALVRRGLGDATRDAVVRGSRIAGWAAVMILASGIGNAWLRLSAASDLWTTAYGRLLSVKIALFGLVVVLAAIYRRFYLPRLTNDEVRARFWRVLSVDIGALVAIVVVAVVLAGSAPPVPILPAGTPSPAYLLTGYALPPAPTAIEWALQWRLEMITGFALASALVVYLRWVARLRRRGDRWPWSRTALWVVGLAILAWVTQGAPTIYGLVSFSGHMVEHMFLVIVVPVPLVLGAPVTLALRALPSRSDGSRGPREWLRAFVESRFLQLLANPIVAAVNFAGSMFVFYYTGVFDWVLHNHVGHVWMAFHFVAVGYFFVNALVGVDPGPRRPAYPLRMVLLFATMAFHAFFGIAIMSSTALLVPRWFGLMGRSWSPDALLDQQIGGQLAWGIGEIPVVLLAIGVAMAWRSSEERVAERQDRQAERDHDAELDRYNAMLAGLDGDRR